MNGVEGVIVDRKISRKLEEKVLMLCVTQANHHGLETVALTERQQQRLQVCENNWVRRIAGVKRVDGRRMDEQREGVGVQMCLTGRLVKCRLKWAGNLMGMGEERMAKRAERLREQVQRERGRQWVRWEDCVRRDISQLGVGEFCWFWDYPFSHNDFNVNSG